MANVTVKRIGVLSLAKIQAMLMAIIGLFIGLIYGLFFMLFGAAMFSQMSGGGGGAAAAGGVIGGVAMIILMPVIYAVFGFIFGAISALVYNAASGFMGGLEMEIEGMSDTIAMPPPPPQQWTPNMYTPPTA